MAISYLRVCVVECAVVVMKEMKMARLASGYMCCGKNSQPFSQTLYTGPRRVTCQEIILFCIWRGGGGTLGSGLWMFIRWYLIVISYNKYCISKGKDTGIVQRIQLICFTFWVIFVANLWDFFLTLSVFSCDSSSIRDIVRQSVGWSVGLLVSQQRVSSCKRTIV